MKNLLGKVSPIITLLPLFILIYFSISFYFVQVTKFVFFFFRLPAASETKEAWLNRLGEDARRRKTIFLCNQHFCDNSFVVSRDSQLRLRPLAVPSRNMVRYRKILPTFLCKQRLKIEVLPQTLETSDSSKDVVVKRQFLEIELDKVPLDAVQFSSAVSCSVKKQNFRLSLQDSPDNNGDVDTPRNVALKRKFPFQSVDSDQHSTLLNDASLCSAVSPSTKKQKTDLDLQNSSKVSPSMDSPRKVALRRKCAVKTRKLEDVRKKLRNLERRKVRLEKKVCDLNSIIAEITKKFNLSEEFSSTLTAAGTGVAELFTRIDGRSKGKKVRKISPGIRVFALNLHFYSPKAYNYVRKAFSDCLPHPRTLRSWYHSVNAEPGLTSESFEILKNKVAELKKQNKDAPVALIIDEMAIKQQVQYFNGKAYGHVDNGTGIEEEFPDIAVDAFVLMVVSYNSFFKIPVGYFFSAGLSANSKKNMVVTCIQELHKIGIKVKSLTFDGASSNLAMAKQLGCSFKNEDLKSSFVNPADSTEKIQIFLDPCHMLKLIRNLFGEYSYLKDDQGNGIKFSYIQNLHLLQEKYGLHLRNKLRKTHIEFKKKKMNVRLAAQLLSNSVADSLQFCLDNKFPEFEGCEATIKFIRTINDLFDIFNSRNVNSFQWKRPICEANQKDIFSRLDTIYAYLSSLKCPETGKLLTATNRKTGILGFLICIQSFKSLYRSLVSTGDLKFLLSYKFSQDHIEIFFGKIRTRLGCNNNPTAFEFKGAYKRLLVHDNLGQFKTGNCTEFDDCLIPILTVSKSSQACKVEAGAASKVYLKQLNNCSDRVRALDDDFFHCESLFVESADNDLIRTNGVLKNVVSYIGGYICRKLRNSVTCESCVDALTDKDPSRFSNDHNSLINFLSYNGKLEYPSKDVFNICVAAESAIREMDLEQTLFANISEKLMKFVKYLSTVPHLVA